MTCPDMSKGHTNNTDSKETEINKTDLIESYPAEDAGDDPVTQPGCDVMDRMEYLKYFEQSLSLDILKIDLPYQKEQLEEIKELLAETCSTGRAHIHIAGGDRPIADVRQRLMSLNSEHIRYVLESLRGTTSRVRNIRQYLLTALYNAPTTMNSYYDALVRHDLYGGGGR